MKKMKMWTELAVGDILSTTEGPVKILTKPHRHKCGSLNFKGKELNTSQVNDFVFDASDLASPFILK